MSFRRLINYTVYALLAVDCVNMVVVVGGGVRLQKIKVQRTIRQQELSELCVLVVTESGCSAVEPQ